jgi:hypothetical protein
MKSAPAATATTAAEPAAQVTGCNRAWLARLRSPRAFAAVRGCAPGSRLRRRAANASRGSGNSAPPRQPARRDARSAVLTAARWRSGGRASDT